MESIFLVVTREDLLQFDLPIQASIKNARHVSSYDWVEAPTPTICIPGAPARWKNLKGPLTVQKDVGTFYVAQNAARHPESPMEPLFRAVFEAERFFDVASIDIVSDRNNIRKLLSFVDPETMQGGLEAFTIDVENVNNTAIFCRTETKVVDNIQPWEFRGFGHNFEAAVTTKQVAGSTGHHRILTYQIGELKLLIRHEVDGYVDDRNVPQLVEQDNSNLSQALEALTLAAGSSSPVVSATSKLCIRKEGFVVPIEQTLEIKTRVRHRPISKAEVGAQMWISQTPKLVRAYHNRGQFQVPAVEDFTDELLNWEKEHQEALKKLVVLLRKISQTAKSCKMARIRYNDQTNKLEILHVGVKRMLPDDLYQNWDEHEDAPAGTTLAKREPQPQRSEATTSTATEFTVKLGDKLHQVPLARIPYFARFESQQTQASECAVASHQDIPLFGTALRGITHGYRECFRQLDVDVDQVRELCKTYKFLEVDVMESNTFDDVAEKIKSGKRTDFKSPVDKRLARDSAFKLVYAILLDKTGTNLNKLYNAVLYVVSHPATFGYKIRRIVRAVYDSQRCATNKQIAELEKWKNDNDAKTSDSTTESCGYSSDGFYGSDWS